MIESSLMYDMIIVPLFQFVNERIPAAKQTSNCPEMLINKRLVGLHICALYGFRMLLLLRYENMFLF